MIALLDKATSNFHLKKVQILKISNSIQMYIYNTLTSYVKCYKQYDSNGMKNYNIDKNHFPIYNIY